MKLTAKELLDAIEAASVLGFPALQETAIDKLEGETIDPFVRLEIAKKLDIKEWLFLAYIDLVLREESITEDEEERLGFRLVIKLGRIREQVAKAQLKSPNRSAESLAIGIIRSTFMLDVAIPKKYDGGKVLYVCNGVYLYSDCATYLTDTIHKMVVKNMVFDSS